MSNKIQITVDDQLNETIKSKAKQLGLSVSSYARLALISSLPAKNSKIINQAIEDIKSNNVEVLTLTEFNHQRKHL